MSYATNPRGESEHQVTYSKIQGLHQPKADAMTILQHCRNEVDEDRSDNDEAANDTRQSNNREYPCSFETGPIDDSAGEHMGEG